jgi:hypothetical protein
MRRALIGLALGAVFCAAHTAAAQDMFSNAKRAAQKAANAADAHVEAEQHPEATPKAQPQKAAPQAEAPKAQPPKAQPPKAVPQPQPLQQGEPKDQPGKHGPKLNVAKADTMSVPSLIYREAFEFSRDGRRDPFVSLLTTNELRPTLSDLKLSNIIYDPYGHRSIAVMRDMTNNAQYRVTTGSTLGRMRVEGIHVLSVVFAIEEFGTSRIDSVVLRDSTKRVR